MATRKQVPKFQPWVESTAGFIADPVKRLRFLRTVAPLTGVHRQRRYLRCFRSGRVVIIAIAGVAVLTSFFLSRATARVAAPPPPPAPAASRPVLPAAHPASEVWRVEESGKFEVYSNGLRIDNTFAVSHRPRSYLAFPADSGRPVERTAPAGIVFHSTESRLAPFEAGHNDALKKIGESLLDYIRRRRSYHFLIDRFGRVYRVVAESDSANHAGHSAWGDAQFLYLNLNESFLGIAFEARTNGADSEAATTTAQARSAVMLTEMLRVRHKIPAANCVTHAQVSVNPSNMRVGYHVDWAAEFPFEVLQLTGNYRIPPPAVWAFGFEPDAAFLSAAGSELRAGVDSAEKILNSRAAAAGLRPAAYRKRLQQQYRQKLAIVRRSGSGRDPDSY